MLMERREAFLLLLVILKEVSLAVSRKSMWIFLSPFLFYLTSQSILFYVLTFIAVFLILLVYVAIAVIFLITIAIKSVNYNWTGCHTEKRIFLRWIFLNTHWTTKTSFMMKCIRLFNIYGQGIRKVIKYLCINLVSLIFPTISVIIFVNQSIILRNAPSSSKIDF